MSTYSLKSALLFVAATSVTSLIMQACGGGSDAIAQTAADADPIEGVWESAVTIRDCSAGTTLATFTGVTQLSRGGAVLATNNQPPTTQGTGYGRWARNAGGDYAVGFRLFRFAPDGRVVGTQKVARTLTLAADYKSMTGTISAQVMDPAGAVLQQVCGSETVTRLY